jgi:hypothetical protein
LLTPGIEQLAKKCRWDVKLPAQFAASSKVREFLRDGAFGETVASTTKRSHYVIETKGRDDIDVANEDRAAVIWCENATLLTDTVWSYIKCLRRVRRPAIGRPRGRGTCVGTS